MGLFRRRGAVPALSGDRLECRYRRQIRPGWPVILVIDASGQAPVRRRHRARLPGLPRDDVHHALAGVILNRVAMPPAPRHAAVAQGHWKKAGIPVLGAMPKRADLVLPERHLGLVQAGDTADLAARLDALAEFCARPYRSRRAHGAGGTLAAFHM